MSPWHGPHGLSVLNGVKGMVALMPLAWGQHLKRLHFQRMIRNGTFVHAEDNDAEFRRLHEWVGPGDWVIDVGANFGNYAARLSELVGPTGRVFAVEPVFTTFEILAANMARLPLRNVTLLNVAASDVAGLVGMDVPKQDNGVDNPYMARVSEHPENLETVMRLPLDALVIPSRVGLVKIDVEGHEYQAVRGMPQLLARDRPVLVVEGRDAEVATYLSQFGYIAEDTPRSPNRLFRVG